ncbi:lipopolysaccharide biosynthesis protein [Bradyrhizobium sp.]|uniref:lipopolysaccharide biosynthesis protein n=1 Tax=Bradyrhizobium sp. TaxID=376 RepID=UPI003C6F9F97
MEFVEMINVCASWRTAHKPCRVVNVLTPDPEQHRSVARCLAETTSRQNDVAARSRQTSAGSGFLLPLQWMFAYTNATGKKRVFEHRQRTMKPDFGKSAPERIRARTTIGASILIATRVAARCVDLAALVVLGRLLSPADFGIVAIAMSVMTVIESVTELPVSLALVSFPVRTRAHFDTAFTIQLARGVALSAILLVAAWPLSWVYSDHRLLALIVALGIAPASRGLQNPRMVDYAIDLNYRPSFAVEVSGKLIALVVSVGSAWLTGSYWSLALGTIAAPFASAVISYWYAPYLPTITLREWREFSRFLRWTTASQLVSALNWQMDQLLLGRLISRLELGRYSMASNLSSMPWQILVVQVMSPLLVGFSMVREDAGRLAAAYRKSSVTIVSVGLPILVGMWLTAEPLVRLILGDQWSESASLLRWLVASTMPNLLVAPLNPLAISLNRTSIFFKLSSIEFIFKLPLMVIAAVYYGLSGVLVVRVVTGVFVTGCSMLAIRGLIKEPVWTQLLAPWRPILSAVAMVLAVVALDGRLANDHDHVQLVFNLVVTAAIGAVVYASSMILLWRAAGRPEGFESNVLGFLGRLARRRLSNPAV